MNPLAKSLCPVQIKLETFLHKFFSFVSFLQFILGQKIFVYQATKEEIFSHDYTNQSLMKTNDQCNMNSLHESQQNEVCVGSIMFQPEKLFQCVLTYTVAFIWLVANLYLLYGMVSFCDQQMFSGGHHMHRD